MRTYRVSGKELRGCVYVESESLDYVRGEYSGLKGDDNLKIEMVYYSCTGVVKGSCGHKHNTIDAAIRCVKKEGNTCATRRTVLRFLMPGNRVESVKEGDSDTHFSVEWRRFK